MTQWQEQTLRPHGQPWPGLNSRGGKLDDGRGWLEDGSINCQINQNDTLSKRKGFVRGLDEWFGSPICGLFTYQDFCGQEYLLVADEDGINIRQPFQLPQFSASDAYPNDQFAGTGSVDDADWRNTSRYTIVSDRLVQASGVAAFSGSKLADALFMRWFKNAGSLSYQVRIDYQFDAGLSSEQRVGIVIRGNGTLSVGSLLQADVVYSPSGTYDLELWHRDSGGTYTKLLSQALDGNPNGTLTFSYERDPGAISFLPKAQIVPSLGTVRNLVAPTLTTLQDADLGLVSALAIGQAGGTVSQTLGIDLVTGGPV